MPEARDYPWEITMFSNGVIILGLILQALLVGSASSVVQNLDSAAADYNRRLKRIRSYLSYMQFAQARARIVFYYRFMWSSTGALTAPIFCQAASASQSPDDILLTRNVFISIPVFKVRRRKRRRPREYIFHPQPRVIERIALAHIPASS